MSVQKALHLDNSPKEERRQLAINTLGGSDIAAAIGASRFKSPYKLYMEKTGQAAWEPAGEWADWGNILEDVVRKEFSKRTNLKTRKSRVTFVNSEFPNFRYSPDGFIQDGGLYEGKTTNVFSGSEWKDDSMPDEYYAQVQCGLLVLEKEWGYAACLIGGQRMEFVRYVRDEEYIKRMVEVANEFWLMVKEGRPPEPSARDRMVDYFPTHETGQVVQADDDLVGVVNLLKDSKERFKKAEETKDRLANMIRAVMQDAEAIVNADGKVLATWKQNKPSVIFDEKAFRAEHPKLYEKFMVKKPGNRVLLTK